MQATRTTILTYAEETWGDLPDYPFAEDHVDAVLRHSDNRKWYALLMTVDRAKLSLPGEGKVDILNIKLDPLIAAPLLHHPGYLPAYHMSKTQWLTILLDGALPLSDVIPLLEMSHHATAKKHRARAAKHPEDSAAN